MARKSGFTFLLAALAALIPALASAELLRGKVGDISYMADDRSQQFIVVMGPFDGLIPDELLRLENYKERLTRLKKFAKKEGIRALVLEDGKERIAITRTTGIGKKSNVNPNNIAFRHGEAADAFVIIPVNKKGEVYYGKKSPKIVDRFLLSYQEQAAGARELQLLDRAAHAGLGFLTIQAAPTASVRALTSTEVLDMLQNQIGFESFVLDPD